MTQDVWFWCRPRIDWIHLRCRCDKRCGLLAYTKKRSYPVFHLRRLRLWRKRPTKTAMAMSGLWSIWRSLQKENAWRRSSHSFCRPLDGTWLEPVYWYGPHPHLHQPVVADRRKWVSPFRQRWKQKVLLRCCRRSFLFVFLDLGCFHMLFVIYCTKCTNMMIDSWTVDLVGNHLKLQVNTAAWWL